MEQLSKDVPKLDGVLQYVSSHPVTAERILAARQAARSSTEDYLENSKDQGRD